MTRTRIATLSLLMIVVTAGSALADVRTEQKTKFQLAGVLGKIVNMFGGKAAKEGITSTVAVKGDRKMTMTDATGQIIDLAEEKVYDLDLKKRNYKVTTFADLRRQMEEARRKAEEDARKAQAKEKPSDEAPDPNQKQFEVEFSIKNTSEKKAVNGFDTHQAIATVTVHEKGKTLEQGGGMVMTTDMWLAPQMPAMKEVADFDMRYAQKLYGPMVAGASAQDMAAAMALYPMMKPAMEKMAAEGGKVEGTPVLTVITMDAVKSEAQLAEEAKNPESEKASGPPTSIGGLFGGLAKKKMAKKEEAEGPQTRANVMTATTEVLKLTTDVSEADVAIPAGFKENR